MNSTSVIVSDLHFGREGYETAHNAAVKVASSQNIADFLSDVGNNKPHIVVVGDFFHRPHWSPAIVQRKGEGFNAVQSQRQVAALTDVFRQGYALTIIDGNCDPWMAMSSIKIDPRMLIHECLLDPREEIAITFAGISSQVNDSFYTHGHILENMHALIRAALRLSTKEKIALVADECQKIINNENAYHKHVAASDHKGSSLFHHIVCQTLLAIEKLEFPCTEAFLPTRYIRHVGSEYSASVISESVSCANIVVGHTHQLNVVHTPKATVWNAGSATGDLHKRPYGTFLVKDAHGMHPYYSWHPDSPTKAVPVPLEHLQHFSMGRRGTI